jgi:hypothetical protein
MKPSNFRTNRPSFSAKSDSFIISFTPIKSQNPDTPISIKRNQEDRKSSSCSSSSSNLKRAARRLRYQRPIHVPRRPVRRRPGEGGSQAKAGLPLETSIPQKTPPFPIGKSLKSSIDMPLFARKRLPFLRFQTYTLEFGNGPPPSRTSRS